MISTYPLHICNLREQIGRQWEEQKQEQKQDQKQFHGSKKKAKVAPKSNHCIVAKPLSNTCVEQVYMYTWVEIQRHKLNLIHPLPHNNNKLVSVYGYVRIQ